MIIVDRPKRKLADTEPEQHPTKLTHPGPSHADSESKMSVTENETGAGDNEEHDTGADMKVAFPAAEDLGQVIASKSLTEVLQENFGGKLSDKPLRDKLAAYPIPQNCWNMGVLHSNHDIFKLPEHQKGWHQNVQYTMQYHKNGCCGSEMRR